MNSSLRRGLLLVLFGVPAAFIGFLVVQAMPRVQDLPRRAPPEVTEPIGRFPGSHFYVERDRFMPATDPQVLLAADASFLSDRDEVFGVVIGGEARAYPITMISYHHVINDQLHGIPIAVTY